jgi:hypothetical protein
MELNESQKDQIRGALNLTLFSSKPVTLLPKTNGIYCVELVNM